MSVEMIVAQTINPKIANCQSVDQREWTFARCSNWAYLAFEYDTETMRRMSHVSHTPASAKKRRQTLADQEWYQDTKSVLRPGQTMNAATM